MNTQTQMESGPRSLHTPGPWTITHDDGGAAEGAAQGLTVIIEREDYEREDGETCGRHIAFCFGDPGNNDPQAIADARLIAAAPELLAACKSAECNCSLRERESGHRSECWYPQMAAAIAKAEGAPSVKPKEPESDGVSEFPKTR